MITPVDTLYFHAEELQKRGHKTISVDFVISMINRQRTFYDKPGLNERGETEKAV